MNTKLTIKLLSLLDEKHFRSGEWLGQQLGVSRAAIWKQLKVFEEFGMDIDAVKGKGYRLKNKLHLFDKNKIISYLPDTFKDQVHVQTYLSTQSTNDSVLENASNKHQFNICVADHQTHGRGRRGRIWNSPLGNNCYYSLRWHTSRGALALEGLSLVIGLTIIRTLESFGAQDLQLKWPMMCYGKVKSLQAFSLK